MVEENSSLATTGCALPFVSIKFGLQIIVLTLHSGVLHILLVLFGRKKLFWDVAEYEPYLPDWTKLQDVGEGLDPHRINITHNVIPVPCHSHNDYWRKHPLFDALRWGCISVEADVWYFEDRSNELFVGHNTASLRPENTFRSLYVNPLVDILDSRNSYNSFSDGQGYGIFDTDPKQTLVLLVDFKTDGHILYPHAKQQLEALRRKDYLSYWDGSGFISRPVTVVGTGNAPFDLILKERDHRDIFFDAPLDFFGKAPARRKKRAQGQTGIDLVTSPKDFNASNSYYASTSFSASIGFPWTGAVTGKQLELIRDQIKGAHQQGLKARYWETPNWPTSLRNYVWSVLVSQGTDILNVDDLRSATALDWNASVSHGWFDA